MRMKRYHHIIRKKSMTFVCVPLNHRPGLPGLLCILYDVFMLPPIPRTFPPLPPHHHSLLPYPPNLPHLPAVRIQD